MPIRPLDLQTSLRHVLEDRRVSPEEVGLLLSTIEGAGGLDLEGATALVDCFVHALRGDQLELRTRAQVGAFNDLMTRLGPQLSVPLGLPRDAAPGLEGEGVDYVAAFERLASGPSDAPTDPLLRLKGFGDRWLQVDRSGKLQLDGEPVALEVEPPDERLAAALWALTRPEASEALSGAPAEARAALVLELQGMVRTALAADPEGPDKYDRTVATAAAVAVLGALGAHWQPATVEAMLAHYAEAPTPLMQAVILRGLASATLSDGQAQALAALERPEHADVLLERFDALRAEKRKVGYRFVVRDAAAQFALSALVFAKTPTAVDNVLSSMRSWLELDRGRAWSPETVAQMTKVLRTYVESYPQVVYQYGTLERDAPAAVANVTSARAVAEARPGLEGDPPKIGEVALTRAQADFILEHIDLVQDSKAVAWLARTVALAASIYEESPPSGWTAAARQAPPSPAAFELFRQAAQGYHDAASAAPSGKLAYRDLFDSLSDPIAQVRDSLREVWPGLHEVPPHWGNIELDAPAAAFVTELLRTRLRSAISTENLGRGVDVIAAHHGGAWSAEATTQLRSVVEGYMAEFPDEPFLHFGKLDRIASYRVRGEKVPPVTLNGREVRLGVLFDQVARTVAGSVNRNKLRHPWMAERWGFRARRTIELVDAVVEQANRGEGPLALVRERHPDAKIIIEASGRPGAHEEIAFAVVEEGKKIHYTQGSDGSIARYYTSLAPILFRAAVGEDGGLQITVPKSIRGGTYPLQTNYTVGDTIDWFYHNTAVDEHRVEGEPFSTTRQVLQAEITGYTPGGRYTVAYETPEGERVSETSTLYGIRKANNPHFYNHRVVAERFSDVVIDGQRDADLDAFLRAAQPIIDRHLPEGLDTATMEPTALARRQMDCIKDLMAYAAEHVVYPDNDDDPDADVPSKDYHERIRLGRVPLGELLAAKRGVCRHQCIVEHLLLQRAGIDSRLSSGAANTRGGDFRGLHIWLEVQLANDERYLSDQTWSDPTIPLWNGAYDRDLRRVEMYHRTARFDSALVS